MHYVDHLTKFHILRPIKSKQAIEVARELLYIFLDIGAPLVLQSDNGREFTAHLISELGSMWPALKLVNGRPRHPQSQGCVERANGDMKNKLTAWCNDNNSNNWSLGVRFAQWAMNSTYHEAIKTEPYRALTGNKPRCGLNSKIPVEFLHQLGCSDIREEVLEHLIQESSTSTSTEVDEPACLPDEPEVEVDEPASLPDEPEVDSDIPDTVNETILECISDNEADHEDSVIADSRVLELQTVAITPAKRKRTEDDHDTSFEHPTKKIREDARAGIEKQAARMVKRSNLKLRPIGPGDNVAVPTSQFDRSKLDSPNVIGVILSADEDGYVVGTKSGRINGKMARNQIEFINFRGLKDTHVPDKELSLREIVRAQSVCGGQGFKRCHCKTNCNTLRCSCRKAGLHCNSACHSHRSCDNVDK